MAKEDGNEIKIVSFQKTVAIFEYEINWKQFDANTLHFHDCINFYLKFARTMADDSFATNLEQSFVENCW